MSLEEARALFSDDSKAKKQSRKRSNKNHSQKSFSKSRSRISNRIKHLERKIMEGDLSKTEEKKILKEIGELEAQLN